MTLTEAREALAVPADTANNNCVIDGQARLREALALAERFKAQHPSNTDEAPEFVLRAVKGLQSWIAHHYRQHS